MVSQCIHIEYKSKNSWSNSVFTLNTKVEVKIEVSWYHGSVFTLNPKVRFNVQNSRIEYHNTAPPSNSPTQQEDRHECNLPCG
ncbi:hypothetical protein OUZ56_032948 [Daphnia magna]|uniref:Uncharacterized protein n=1 Tax=Daphnia magna TaxID=35525 RepID=A0ABQ9ZXA9_9CRUS|nr:hypothetical protein OUZ56_032948 [Daphnia magna]